MATYVAPLPYSWLESENARLRDEVESLRRVLMAIVADQPECKLTISDRAVNSIGFDSVLTSVPDPKERCIRLHLDRR